VPGEPAVLADAAVLGACVDEGDVGGHG
jgi:hypothetical protein